MSDAAMARRTPDSIEGRWLGCTCCTCPFHTSRPRIKALRGSLNSDTPTPTPDPRRGPEVKSLRDNRLSTLTGWMKCGAGFSRTVMRRQMGEEDAPEASDALRHTAAVPMSPGARARVKK